MTDFIVILPGATGGGRYITVLRDAFHKQFGENVWIPSSVSTPEGFLVNENLGQRYDRLGKYIDQKIVDKNLILIGHSLGAIEISNILEKLSKTPQKIILISPPLMKMNWIVGYIKLFLFPAFYEQFVYDPPNTKNRLKIFLRSFGLHKAIQDEFHGRNVKEELHGKYLAKYGEENVNKKGYLKYYRQFLKDTWSSWYKGVELPPNSKVIQIISEHDPLSLDYPGVTQKYYLEKAAHSSLGYRPEILIKILQTITS